MKKFYSIFPLFLLTACSKKVSDMSGWEILGLAAVILIPIALWSMESETAASNERERHRREDREERERRREEEEEE